MSFGVNPNPLLLFICGICTTNVRNLLFFDDLLRAKRRQQRQEKAITDCTDFTEESPKSEVRVPG
jgi:hypothetical protein